MSVKGVVSVRRFKTEAQGRIDNPYISVTEVEAETAEALQEELREKASVLRIVGGRLRL